MANYTNVSINVVGVGHNVIPFLDVFFVSKLHVKDNTTIQQQGLFEV